MENARPRISDFFFSIETPIVSFVNRWNHILCEAEVYEPWSEKHILHEAELHEFMAFSHQHAILHQAWLYALICIHELLFLFKPECIPKF